MFGKCSGTGALFDNVEKEKEEEEEEEEEGWREVILTLKPVSEVQDLVRRCYIHSCDIYTQCVCMVHQTLLSS